MHRRHAQHRGFTLLEILVAVAIIAILAGMLVYGLEHMLRSSKTSATKLMLQNAQSILGEYDKATQLKRDTGHWPWCFYETGDIAVINAGSIVPVTIAPPRPAPVNVAPSFWSYPWRIDSSLAYGTLDQLDHAAPMLAPVGSFNAADGDAAVQRRNSSYAVLYTQLAMRMIGGVSSAKTMISNIQSGGLMVPEWQSTCSWYALGNTVKVTGGGSVTFYQATKDYPAATFGSYNPDGTVKVAGDWMPVASADPILLDAWGNPILLVPSSGLVGVWTNGKPGAAGAVRSWQDYTGYPSGPGIVPRNTNDTGPIVSPNGKPFFVSAGPDGDFSTGDDNVYSWE